MRRIPEVDVLCGEGKFGMGCLDQLKIHMSLNRQRGFSLLELMITIAIGLTIAGITFMAMRPLFNRSHLDNAYDTALMALRDTRHLAITQSHEYYVNFNPAGFAAGTITVMYQPAAVAGVLPAQQFVKSYTLPTDITFAVVAGFPANAPDNFGTGIAAIDFGQGLGLGSLKYVCFMPDGSSRDSLGNYNSGVIYLTRALDTMYSSRAVSVWGATGRVRGWRLVQQAGAPVWMQQ
jgi:prepilin-type N-terminal cleavage/methylation domain-containing protein